MGKIDLNDFLNCLNITLDYSMEHILNENWENKENPSLRKRFDAMNRNVQAISKLLEYQETLKDYSETDTRESIFLNKTR